MIFGNAFVSLNNKSMFSSPSLNHDLRQVITFFKYLLLNFWSTMDKLMVPEFKLRILNKFNKCDQQAPWMWPVNNQSL